MALTTGVENLKYNNLKLSKSVKIAHENQNGKGKHSQQSKVNVKGKTKGNK